MQGTRYGAAKLRDPDVIEALAQMPEPTESDIPLEGFGPIEARLANLEDRLTQLIYAVAHADPAGAPHTPRPRMPHVVRRGELRRESSRAFELQLIPGGD